MKVSMQEVYKCSGIKSQHPNLPCAFELEEHPLVPKPHGWIILLLQDLLESAMSGTLKYSALVTIPSNEASYQDLGV